MGIKHLWTILGPFCERKPLFELQGKTVAVDLSGWICEAQNITEYQVQPKMYLRNLYFRTCFLLLMEVNPVFVLEGKAPELKFDTIAARNAIQFKGAKPKSDKVKTGKDRTRFHFVLRQCQEMLGYMGLACLKGNGEAESLCAYLSEDGLVDGCISQDSDCFAYGAKVVYRNFSISQQGAFAASGGAVDIYDIRKVENSIDFGRNKIVVLSLLCGSDYNSGVHGVGKDSAMKLFEKIEDKNIIEYIRSWRSNKDHFAELERKISDKNTCTSCGHYGKVQNHSKNGCNSCHTFKGCDSTKFKEERSRIKNEISVRSKAIEDESFPNEVLMNEFLERKDNVAELNLKWKKPDLINFIKFTVKHLGWEEIYSFEKFLPILTRWQLLNYSKISNQTRGIVHPDYIKKARNPKGIPSYEIIWKDAVNYFANIIPKEQLENIDLVKLWSTIEPQKFVETAYPELVSAFLATKKKPVKRKTKKDAENLLNTSASEPIIKKVRKPRKPKTQPDALNVLEDSFSKLNINLNKRNVPTLERFLTKETVASSTPLKSQCSFELDMSNFEDDDDNLSDIVDNIISRETPCVIQEKVKEFKAEYIEENRMEMCNASSFFITNPIEEDLFEKTFNDRRVSESEEKTEEYDLDEYLQENDQGCNVLSDESEEEEYVPLYERLMNKLK